MFSPMVAIASWIARSTVTSPTGAALIFSTSAPTLSATWAIILTRPWNCSLRATKSVSELTSTTTPLVPAVSAPIRPSAAMRPDFLAAFDRPFLRSQSIAASMSPSFSASACLQSIMPTPVVSRRSLTIAAVIVAIVECPSCLSGRRAARLLPPRRRSTTRECRIWNRSGGREIPATLVRVIPLPRSSPWPGLPSHRRGTEARPLRRSCARCRDRVRRAASNGRCRDR